MTTAAAITGGLVLLWVSSGAFVTGAVRLAARLRMSPITIGAIVVGFGTSLPEAVVSGLAAAQGFRQIAIGNIIGSNLANVMLILGILGLLASPRVASATLRRELPLAMVAVVTFGIVLRTAPTRAAGVLLIGALVAVVVLMTKWGAGEPIDAPPPEAISLPLEIFRVVAGLIGTTAGAEFLVRGASDTAAALGLAEGFVGLTIVAVGTSLPELAASIQAMRRDFAELALGNILGSSIFNSFGIGGLIALINPGAAAPDLAGAATFAMIGATVATAFLLWTGRRLERWEAAGLLLGYVLVIAISAG